MIFVWAYVYMNINLAPQGGLNFPATIYTLGEEAFVQLVTDLPKIGRRFASIAATCVGIMYPQIYISTYTYM